MNGYVEGYTTEAIYCPFCGGEIYNRSVDGSNTCEECQKRFYVVEDENN